MRHVIVVGAGVFGTWTAFHLRQNTSSGDFLIDRHPGHDNVWIVGGGSGHGFKHGPAVGELAARLVLTGAPAEPRFSLATKTAVSSRSVY